MSKRSASVCHGWMTNDHIYVQSAGASELFSGCLCHGYLDVYASLWTTWKLMCEASSSEDRGGRKISSRNAVTFEFKGTVTVNLGGEGKFPKIQHFF